MKNIFTLYLLVGLGLAACAQVNSDKEPFLTRSLGKESIKNVMVRTSGGSISVTGVGAGEARLEMYVSANNIFGAPSKEEIQKRLDENYELTIEVKNNVLTAIAKQKPGFSNWRRGLSISFRIYVPNDVSTDLGTSGGSIRLLALNGRHDFKTSGGSLDIDQLTGTINGKTSGGSITVKNAKDNIDLRTSGGSITASNCSGTIRLNTSGGSLHLDKLRGDIKAETSGGSVHGDDIVGDLSAHTSGGSVTLNAIAGSLETSTSGGSIHADIRELGKYVSIRNSGGNVDLQLPDNKGLNLDLHANRISFSTMKNFTGKKDDNEMSGTINGGGVPVTVKASSGRLSLALK